MDPNTYYVTKQRSEGSAEPVISRVEEKGAFRAMEMVHIFP
jgi:hypothetical protein